MTVASLSRALKPTLRCAFQFSRFSTTSTLLAPAGVEGKRLPRGFNAPNGYVIFVKDHFDRSKSGPENVKVLAPQWKKLSVAQKKEYSKKSADIAAQRRRDFERLSTAEQASKRDEAKERVERIQRRRKKLERRAFNLRTGRPKLPLTAYTIFAQENLKRVQPKTVQEASATVKEVAGKWKALSDAEKKPYVDEAARLKEAYTKDLDKWQKKVGLKTASKRLAGGKAKKRGRPATVKSRKSTKTGQPAKRGRAPTKKAV
ncbi:Protein HMG-5 [Aphelenchoides avenae]|nr:Protein HMG-5 [Aphelenchus avenae]